MDPGKFGIFCQLRYPIRSVLPITVIMHITVIIAHTVLNVGFSLEVQVRDSHLHTALQLSLPARSRFRLVAARIRTAASRLAPA
jgi:hypothetical protein